MEIKEVLSKNKFQFKKALGQNFISDGNLLRAIVADSGITENDTVVEIGTGAGTLTSYLSQKAKRVVTFEVDTDLEPILNETLGDKKNVEIVFADVLKMSDDDFKKKVPEKFKVVANLPYYITTPMIMRFLESTLNAESMTLMMQKEVADRLVAKPGTENYGAITVAVEASTNASITRIIDRRMFYPVPNVDSALVRMDFVKNKYDFTDFAVFKKVARSAFMMRRKTLVNNLIATFPISKAECENIIEKLGFSKTVRGETLSCADFVKVSDILYNLFNEKKN